MSYVTGISGNVISAASAGWAPTNSAEVSAIASAYATGGNYTAGNGIVITGNEISVNYDSNTLDTVAGTVTITAAASMQYDPYMHVYDAGFVSLLNGQTSANITVHIPEGFFSTSMYFGMEGYNVYLALCTYDPREGGTPNVYTDAPLSYTYDSLNDEYVIDEQDVVLSLPTSGEDWYPGTSLGFSDPIIAIVIAMDPNMGTSNPVDYIAGDSYTCTITYPSASSQALTVKNPLPASTSADANKVLTVNASGSPVWAVGGGGVDSATVSAIASSYAESAVSSKADSSALSSYALSADVSGTVDLVSTQSANWGGSALALSAGPGVKLEKVGDTLVASTDETLLWSGANASSAQLSEAYTNFERISFVVGFPAQAGHVLTFDVGSMATAFNLLFPFGNTYAYFCNAKASFTTTDTVQVSDAKYVYTPYGTSTQVTTETSNVNNAKTCLQKIIGIRRTAEA